MSSPARDSGESRSAWRKGQPCRNRSVGLEGFVARRLGGLVNTGPLSFGT